MNRAASLLIAAGFAAMAMLLLNGVFQTPERTPTQSFMAMSGFPVLTGTPVAMQRRPAATMNQPNIKNQQAVGAYVAPNVQLAEAHWQGLEAVPLTKTLKQKLQLPATLKGLLVDETTLAGARSGLQAGDVLVAVAGKPVRTLKDLLRASKRVQQQEAVTLSVFRQSLLTAAPNPGSARRAKPWLDVILYAKGGLGFAQVETAPMILPADVPPHAPRGVCTDCHPIGTFGHMVPDPDAITLPVPPIRAGTPSPHRDRGPCEACHTLL